MAEVYWGGHVEEEEVGVERDHSPSRWRATNKGWPLASSDVEDSTPGD